MIPFLKGFSWLKALNEHEMTDGLAANKGMFYVKMNDGVWGEQIAEF